MAILNLFCYIHFHKNPTEDTSTVIMIRHYWVIIVRSRKRKVKIKTNFFDKVFITINGDLKITKSLIFDLGYPHCPVHKNPFEINIRGQILI